MSAFMFGPLGNPTTNLDITGQRGVTDHPTYTDIPDNVVGFYPAFCTVVARDRPPEGDRYAVATWGEEMSSGRYYNFYPQNYGANDAPVPTEQDHMLIGRSLVNPSLP